VAALNQAQSLLGKKIYQQSEQFISLSLQVSENWRTRKEIEGTGGKINLSDLIAYQIGWGKLLLSWYECGLKGKKPVMPGEGFSTWDYVGLARHFSVKYGDPKLLRQIQVFRETVNKILDMIETESQSGDLERIGIWSWCTLASGKAWPLSKWITVNTLSPYKRACSMIRRFLKKLKDTHST
jgi:hypothetical protein